MVGVAGPHDKGLDQKGEEEKGLESSGHSTAPSTNTTHHITVKSIIDRLIDQSALLCYTLMLVCSLLGSIFTAFQRYTEKKHRYSPV